MLFQLTCRSLVIALLLFFSKASIGQDSFITTWNTENFGASASNSIRIPLNNSSGNLQYDFTIDWGDGELTSFDGPLLQITHVYDDPGSYDITIEGTFPAISFNNEGDRLKLLSIEQWDNTPWATLENAFFGCENLQINAVDAPNLNAVTSLASAFSGCTSLNTSLNHWDVSSVTDMRSTFENCYQFNQPFDEWDVSNVTTMRAMFRNTALFNGDLTTWQTGNVTDMGRLFEGVFVFNQDISNWDVSQVSVFTRTFAGAGAFNQDLSNWNTGSAVEMNFMFSNATSFNQPLNSWDVSNVTNFHQMFSLAQSFNQDLNDWDMQSAQDLSWMFRLAPAFNGDVSSWNTSSVTDLNHMFSGAAVFNRDISNWIVSNVTNMRSMFSQAIAFDQDLSDWDVSNVTNMWSMFHNAESFNQAIGGWDVSNVENFSWMFNQAAAFDQDLSGWNISSGTTLQSIFNNCGLSTCNYDKLLIAWSQLPLQTQVAMNAAGIQYTQNAAAARQAILDNFSWFIADGGLNAASYNLLNIDNVVINPPSCHDSSDAGLEANTFGGVSPLEVVWSNASGILYEGAIQNNLASGTYHLTIVDAIGCSVSIEVVEIEAPDAISIGGLTSTAPTCHGGNDGMIELSFTGGTGTLNFEWQMNEMFYSDEELLFDLSAETYDLTVTDENGCTFNVSLNVGQPEELIINGEVIDNAITTNITGGIGLLEYTWQGPNGFTSDAQALSELDPGEYVLTVTDENGCTANATFVIEDTSISSRPSTEALLAYPNPANALITVELPSARQGVVELFNAAGQRVNATPVQMLQTSVHVGDLPVGWYLVTFIDLNGVMLAKSPLLIQR